MIESVLDTIHKAEGVSGLRTISVQLGKLLIQENFSSKEMITIQDRLHNKYWAAETAFEYGAVCTNGYGTRSNRGIRRIERRNL
jgi:hypothetical protein